VPAGTTPKEMVQGLGVSRAPFDVAARTGDERRKSAKKQERWEKFCREKSLVTYNLSSVAKLLSATGGSETLPSPLVPKDRTLI
jgi:hypothetical protein